MRVPETANLVQAVSLSKHFPRRRSFISGLVRREPPAVVRAVREVSLGIKRGETVGLVGESGCGKTTFGRTLMGLYRPTAGQVLFAGKEVKTGTFAARREYYRKAQMIFQNPYASLNPRKTVREILLSPLHNLTDLPPAEREERVRGLADRVGLKKWQLDSYPHQFSGGQRQRIGIARALAVNPAFIVADEPVSALDVSIQAQIINLMEGLKAEFGLTYLFIAHDLSVVFYISDRTAVMYLGRIVEIAPTEELFRHSLHPYTQALLSAIPSIRRRNRQKMIRLQGGVPSPIAIPPGCPFHPRCFARKGQKCTTVEPVLGEVASGHYVACHRAELGEIS
ncbi:MAG: ABC transporter ATP-binding protein [bacterium]|jgi:oligopeptide/dipeptide ABC transporter ATP-binding protein